MHLEAQIGIPHNRFICKCGNRFILLIELIDHARKSHCYSTRAGKKGVVLLAIDGFNEEIIEVEFE